MVRQRKILKNSLNESSSSSGSEASIRNTRFFLLAQWKTCVGVICLTIAVYVSVLGYLETRVNTPFDDEKIVRDSAMVSSSRFWGSYRPGVYMGMKSREPRSPVYGLMWYELAPAAQKGIRHWCEQGDNLPQYGWTRHDGVTFGEQLILDPPHKIVTSFVKSEPTQRGSHWTVRVNVTSTDGSRAPFTLVWYAALDESLGADDSRLWAERGQVMGYTRTHDNFKLLLQVLHGKVYHKSISEAHAPGLHQLKEKFISLLKVERHPTFGRLAVLGPDDTLSEERGVNFIPIQLVVEPPFAVDIVYSTESVHSTPLVNELYERGVNFIPIQLVVEPPFAVDIVYSTESVHSTPLVKEEYTRALEERVEAFDREFEEKFNLSASGYSEEDVSTAKAALANMVGGIGYFYGAGRVQSQYTSEPVPYWRAALYTAVPSRSFFPRGFLWDEGFHVELISRWQPDIAVDIAAHWLDLINSQGWIPREQILGPEALARVPKEFVVQSNLHANPPMLLISLAAMTSRHPELFEPRAVHAATLARMYPRLQAWFNWYQSTQKGGEPTSYRWRGRSEDNNELNPKTLSSGLDDYPRASHPSDIERHLDLRCWMFAAADAMARIATTLHQDASRYEEIRDLLSDEELLNSLHWSSHSQTYADYGLHSDSVRLVKQRQRNVPGEGKVVRLVNTPPQPRLVTSAFGYVSLFPLLLKVLAPNSEKLGRILDSLDNPALLWSPYGLRSLSKSAPLFMKRNTEHDPPYWRGQVWININYLALAALRHYASEGIHAARARQLHTALRQNVVSNILREYKRTGYLWEQYSSSDGRGSGCRPFSGWTALLPVLMQA